MRNIDERMDFVMQRTNELKQAKRRRSYHILSLSAATACLVLVIGTALVMPQVMSQLSVKEYTDVIGFASIFSSGNSMGYLLIAVLGFVLGICLTILCVYLRKRSLEEQDND